MEAPDPLVIIAAANTILLMPVYFILSRLQSEIHTLRSSMMSVMSDNAYLKGQLDQLAKEHK